MLCGPLCWQHMEAKVTPDRLQIPPCFRRWQQMPWRTWHWQSGHWQEQQRRQQAQQARGRRRRHLLQQAQQRV